MTAYAGRFFLCVLLAVQCAALRRRSKNEIRATSEIFMLTFKRVCVDAELVRQLCSIYGRVFEAAAAGTKRHFCAFLSHLWILLIITFVVHEERKHHRHISCFHAPAFALQWLYVTAPQSLKDSLIADLLNMLPILLLFKSYLECIYI